MTSPSLFSSLKFSSPMAHLLLFQVIPRLIHSVLFLLHYSLWQNCELFIPPMLSLSPSKIETLQPFLGHQQAYSPPPVMVTEMPEKPQPQGRKNWSVVSCFRYETPSWRKASFTLNLFSQPHCSSLLWKVLATSSWSLQTTELQAASTRIGFQGHLAHHTLFGGVWETVGLVWGVRRRGPLTNHWWRQKSSSTSPRLFPREKAGDCDLLTGPAES